VDRQSVADPGVMYAIAKKEFQLMMQQGIARLSKSQSMVISSTPVAEEKQRKQTLQ